MKVAASNRVVARNGIGEFIADVENAARDTIEEAVEQGATISRQLAPSGSKPDPRTSKLSSSIEPRVLSRTSGEWRATARHALPQELGAAAHRISGNPGLKFFWDKEGRMFMPAIGKRTSVNHPGNPAHPYLRPAYEAVMAHIMEIARRNYPG